jgi:enoyl-CoA hydratase/carnithine racemase
MTHQYIDVAESDGVLIIKMDDPSTRNAIGDQMATEIVGEIDRLESDPDLRTLVLTGRDPSFCSGANVRRMDQANRDRPDEPSLPSDTRPWDYFDQKLEELTEETEVGGGRNVPLRLHHLQKPSIAAVNGYAIGLGMGIALSCDIRIASENARFSETFIKRGLIPADGSCWQLPRIIGLSNTLLLQYTGDFVEADDAMRLGLVSRVTPHDELMDTTMELARRLAGGPTYTMAIVKKLVQMSLQTDFDESMRLAGPAQDIARSTEDHREGVRSFLEKRPPRFTGR